MQFMVSVCHRLNTVQVVWATFRNTCTSWIALPFVFLFMFRLGANKHIASHISSVGRERTTGGYCVTYRNALQNVDLGRCKALQSKSVWTYAFGTNPQHMM